MKHFLLLVGIQYLINAYVNASVEEVLITYELERHT